MTCLFPFNPMTDIIQSTTQEFWHSPLAGRPRPAVAAPSLSSACSGCTAEFIPGAAFCHSCGSARALQLSEGWISHLEISHLQLAVGLSRPSFVAFFLGLAFALAALLSGVFSNPQTVMDWQVVQAWRIEWLLASVAAFVAGILLKRPVSR